ncbi:MAG: proline dehydrogenase family protein [Candidatus Marsarchaeota archaeon]|jgi:proline dehydrogenase|nr:proline dehydrogenase family protein [Candidatus Marsarchaeota archaeon]MCL5115124.1 proline dehydrogenase family protein [Candidatus Marsarchaeota archaeon]
MLEKLIAGRWIAGTTMNDGLRKAAELNRVGIRAILNNLGEDVKDLEAAASAKGEYIELVRRIGSGRIKADIALKLTDLGLVLDKEKCKKNYLEIVRYAARHGIFIWIDMEEHYLVERTIGIYKSALQYGNAGICLQAYLRRSISDMKAMRGSRAVIRLVKGAYSESADVAYRSRKEITDNYAKMMVYLFKNFVKFTIATHDQSLIDMALHLNDRYKRRVTYAMLNGVRNRYAERLSGSGEDVSIYVPFGRDWTGYALRRLHEASGIRTVFNSLLNLAQN